MAKFLIYTTLPSGNIAFASKRTEDTDEATFTFAKSEALQFTLAIDAQQIANIRTTEFSYYLHPKANIRELPARLWKVAPENEI